jgi:hypothetical protein
MSEQELLNNFAKELYFGSSLTDAQKVEVMTDLVNAIYTTEKDNQ